MEASKLKKGKSKTKSVFFILNLWNGKRFYNFGPQATELIRKDLRTVALKPFITLSINDIKYCSVKLQK